MKLGQYFSTFRGKLTSLIIAAILLPLLVAALIWGNILHRQIHDSFRNELAAGLGTIELVLASQEENLVSTIDRVADDKSLEDNLSLETLPQLKRAVKTQRKVMDYSWLAVFDRKHNLMAASKFKSKNIAFDFNLAERLQVVQDGEFYYAVYLAPIRKKGITLGLVAGGVLLNSDELLIYLQERHILNTAFWLDGKLILTEFLPQAVPVPIGRGQEGELVELKDGKRHYKGIIRSRALDGHTFEYGLFIPMARLQHAILEMVVSLILIVAVLFLVFLALSTFVVNRMVRPLRQLTDHAIQLSSTNFALHDGTALAGLASGSRDEIAKLADSFVHMERQLRTYLHDLTETTRAKEKIHSELRIAREIQSSMLPHSLPALSSFPGYDISAVMEPAHEVGGDFYDYFMVDDNNLCVVIGDVSDKGVPASLFMAVSKTLLRAVTTLTRTVALTPGLMPEQVVSRVNHELCRDNGMFMFVTIFYGMLNHQTGELSYSIAGHNPPYLVSSARGVMPLPSPGGVPLGIKPAAQFNSSRVTLQPGDTLFLYTDGITEAMDVNGTQYSEQRLEAYLQQQESCNSAAEMARLMVEEVKRFSGEAPQNDDMTVVVLKHLLNGTPD